MRDGFAFRLVQVRGMLERLRKEPTPEMVYLIQRFLSVAYAENEEVALIEREIEQIMHAYYIRVAKDYLEKLRSELREEYCFYVNMYLESAESEIEVLGITEEEFDQLWKQSIIKDARKAHAALKAGDRLKYIYVLEVLAYGKLSAEDIGTTKDQLLQDYLATWT